MSKQNPRCMLTLKPETYEVVGRWAESQGKPMATAISALLDEQRPMLLMMAEAFEKAQAGKSEAAMRAIQSMTGRALGLLGAAMEGKKPKPSAGALGLIGAAKKHK